MRCYVYWIKRKHYTNPDEEGYVGISNDPQRRFGEHHLSDFKVGNAIRKYKENKGNTKQWKVISPNGKTFYVENLKTWCKQKSIPYLTTFKNGWKGWRCYKDTSSAM